GGTAPTSSGGTVRLGDACATLAHWNLRWDAGQRGAVLFGQFWHFASGASPSPFSHRFELAHPVTTPFGLYPANPAVRDARGRAGRRGGPRWGGRPRRPCRSTRRSARPSSSATTAATSPSRAAPATRTGSTTRSTWQTSRVTRRRRRTTARRSSRW